MKRHKLNIKQEIAILERAIDKLVKEGKVMRIIVDGEPAVRLTEKGLAEGDLLRKVMDIIR